MSLVTEPIEDNFSYNMEKQIYTQQLLVLNMLQACGSLFTSGRNINGPCDE